MRSLEGLTESQIVERLQDPHWRLRNLYYVLDKDKNTVLFTPNEVQEEFLRNLWYRNIVPKARQRGFSTVTQLMILDTCIFVSDTMAAIIAQDSKTAEGIRNSKIKFAYDRLDPAIREERCLVKDNVDELTWNNNSSLVVTSSARGGTLQLLHVSEYGLICKKNPERAKEIRDGSLPAVATYGIAIIESTAEGRAGDFALKTFQAKKLADQGKKLTPIDFRLHFASWWDAAEYEVDPDLVTVSSVDHAYFDRIEAEIGREIGPRKRAWYVNTRDATFSGDQEAMWSQYPSTLDEAFQVSADGIYLSKQLTKARLDGRIGAYPYRPGLPVNTFWDIGVADDIAIWFHQRVDGMDHWIDYYEISGEPYAPIVRDLQAKGYVWGSHYLPHDAAHRRPGMLALKTVADMLGELGLTNIEIVPVIDEVINGINMLRQDFANYRFNEPTTKPGVVHLDGFSKVWNERTETWSTQPAKNGHQHAADAIRQKAQAEDCGMIIGGGRSTKVRRRNGSGLAA